MMDPLAPEAPGLAGNEKNNNGSDQGRQVPDGVGSHLYCTEYWNRARMMNDSELIAGRIFFSP